MTVVPLIPVPPLRLPEWSDEVGEAWMARSEQAAALGRGVGVGRNFGQLVSEARLLLQEGDPEALGTRVRDRRFGRAVITAWLDDEDLVRSTMSPELVRNLSARSRPSRLTTIAVAHLFFTHFDRLDSFRAGLFVATRDLLRTAVTSQHVGRGGDLVDTIRENATVMLEPDGPIRLAVGLLTTGGDVTAWFHANHLTALSDSRFGRIARDTFYLTAIERADAERGDHAFLAHVTSEVRIRERSESTEHDRLYFGHQVLTALTAKLTRNPSRAWLEAVLDVGGDPRLSQTPAWQMWWSKVPEVNRDRAVRWMRGVDLHAFLDGVEEYAKETRNHAMVAMLEPRKRLLLGLYEQDRVEDVRLILGASIRRWIQGEARVALVDAARLDGSGKQDTAVIYVDCGDFCLVEGSHNVSLHVYVGGPIPTLASRRNRRFDYADLRDVVPGRHLQAYGQGSHLGVPHLGGEWIRRALDFLRERGITVDERGLMTPNDFADLSRRRARDRY